MSRLDTLRDAIHPGSRGIEIGPWRNPIAPKRDGLQTLVIDILGTAELREKATRMKVHDVQIAGIEEVDIVGDASRLLELVRGRGVADGFDWIVSSHNFEHLPDPIRFLGDCESLLKPSGFVGMILPDKRHCMDRFRPATTFADFCVRITIAQESQLRPTRCLPNSRSKPRSCCPMEPCTVPGRRTSTSRSCCEPRTSATNKRCSRGGWRRRPHRNSTATGGSSHPPHSSWPCSTSTSRASRISCSRNLFLQMTGRTFLSGCVRATRVRCARKNTRRDAANCAGESKTRRPR